MYLETENKVPFPSLLLYISKVHYVCNVCRHSKPTSKKAEKQGGSKTRANGCNSFIRFQFSANETCLVCVVGLQRKHTGHNIHDEEEARVSRIDPDLKLFIELLLDQVRDQIRLRD